MRRSIALVTVAGLALGLAACGGDDKKADETTSAADKTTEATTSEAPAGGGEITVWVDANREPAFKVAAQNYETATGNKVNLVVKENDQMRTEFLSQVPTGKGPDISFGAHDWLGEMVANGVVAPITLGDKAAEFNPTAIQAVTLDGQVYGVPYSVENVAIIRNTKLADSTPATFDEMIAKGKAAGTKYAFLVQVGETGDPYTLAAFQNSFGAPVFESENGLYTSKLALGGENGNAFAAWLAAQGKAGTLDTAVNYDVAVEAFKNGESPYILGGPWMIADFKAAGIDVAVDPIPSAGPNPSQPFMGVQQGFVSSKSANQLLAIDFLVNYVSTEEIQTELFNIGYRQPALTAAADKAASDTAMAGFAKAGEASIPMPNIPEMGAVWGFWGVTEAQIISGTATDPAAAWAKMASDIQADLDK